MGDEEEAGAEDDGSDGEGGDAQPAEAASQPETTLRRSWRSWRYGISEDVVVKLLDGTSPTAVVVPMEVNLAETGGIMGGVLTYNEKVFGAKTAVELFMVSHIQPPLVYESPASALVVRSNMGRFKEG